MQFGNICGKGRVLNRFSKDIGFMDDTLILKLAIFLTVRIIIV